MFRRELVTFQPTQSELLWFDSSELNSPEQRGQSMSQSFLFAEEACVPALKFKRIVLVMPNCCQCLAEVQCRGTLGCNLTGQLNHTLQVLQGIV